MEDTYLTHFELELSEYLQAPRPAESQQRVSYIYHVVYGEGYSTIMSPGMDKPQRITWSSKDTLAVPAWSKLTHSCTLNKGDAFLVAINDRPMVEALSLLRDLSDFSISAD